MGVSKFGGLVVSLIKGRLPGNASRIAVSIAPSGTPAVSGARSAASARPDKIAGAATVPLRPCKNDRRSMRPPEKHYKTTIHNVKWGLQPRKRHFAFEPILGRPRLDPKQPVL